MNVLDYIKGRRTKSDPLPGTTDGEVDRPCPACGKKMLIYKKCCGNPNGYIGCCDLSCNYKESL